MGALASLGDPEFIASVRAEVEAGRCEYMQLAADMDLVALESATNFVAIDVGGGDRARRLLELLQARGVFVRMPGVAPWIGASASLSALRRSAACSPSAFATRSRPSATRLDVGREPERMTRARKVPIAVDIGGTFTDVAIAVGDGFVTAKIPTTPSDPVRGVMDAIAVALDRAGLAPGDVASVVHGTTLATNALIERKGATVGLITTEASRHPRDSLRASLRPVRHLSRQA